MTQAPVLEVRRPLQQRLDHLVAIYGVQDPAALAEATRRIARRLGPQRTAAALAAIELGDWRTACGQMLDYYDRCYDHELQAHPVDPVDLGDRDPDTAAGLLLERGLVGGS
jgi:tRNA 2-selenouridine synthase